MRWLVLAFMVWATMVSAQTVTPKTITPIWFRHGSGAVGACSYTDGSSGAPAGAVALYPTLLASYAHPPSGVCKWPETDYGVGATGLGTPAAITANSTASTTMTFGGGVPGYFATGQSIVDISNYPPCINTPVTITAIAATTITVSSAVTCGSGTTFATFHPVTCTGFGSTCVAYSPPAGVSLDNTNLLVDVSGNNRTITGVDLSFHGSYAIFTSGSMTGLTITNNFGRITSGGSCAGGPTACDPIIINVGATSGTITDNYFDGNNVSDNEDSLIGVYSSGTWTIEYNRVIRAYSDCFNLSTANAAVYTNPVIEFNSCIDNASGNNSGAHADWLQSFGFPAGGTINNEIFDVNFWIIDSATNASGNQAGGQGWSCGDGLVCNSNVETLNNLVILKITSPGSSCGATCTTGINHVFQIDRNASLGTYTVTGSYVDNTGNFGNLLCQTPSGGSGCGASSGGTIVQNNNLNLKTGANITP